MFKNKFRSFVRMKFPWYLIKYTLGTASKLYLKIYRFRARNDQSYLCNISELSNFDHLMSDIFLDLSVRSGPFKGMRYPSFESVGSALYPKLIGSYEREISPAILQIIDRPYTSILDIGCAEGYYAVGFGLCRPDISIYAFDTDSKARRVCKQMADLNGVKLQIGEFCDNEMLLRLDLGERALIFSDCEGYEQELFSRSLVDSLARHDFLIETHDFLEIEITRNLLKVFSETHKCTIYESIDDIIKAYTYEYPEGTGLSLRHRKRLFAENRPQIMRWIFAESKSFL